MHNVDMELLNYCEREKVHAYVHMLNETLMDGTILNVEAFKHITP